MAFRPLAHVAARWRPVEGEGLEHLDLRMEGEDIVASGVIIGARGGTPYGVRYRIVCDPDWSVTSLDVFAADGRSVRLRSDGEGNWQNIDGFPVARYDGCIDVDLAGSPFTNTLPIRRLELGPGDAPEECRMLYVPFDTFKPTVDGQRYTCIGAGLYRYEAMDRTFSADLTVDEDGLVTDYPTLFRRVAI